MTNGRLSDKAYKAILRNSEDVKKRYSDIIEANGKDKYFFKRSEKCTARRFMYTEYKNNMLTNFLEEPSAIILEFAPL